MSRLCYKGKIYPHMIIRLLIVLLFFSLSRLQFFLFNTHYFNDLDGDAIMMAFLGGIRFDITAVIVLNSLYILMNVIPQPFRYKRYWQTPSNIIFYLTNITGFALNSIDTVYFRFTSKRMTADIFSFLGTGEEDFIHLAPSFLTDFAWEFTTWIVMSVLFVWIISRIKLKDPKNVHGFRYYFVNTVFFLLTGTLGVIGIRGGFQLRPITIIDAGKYACAKNVSLVLNTPFSIIKSFGHTGLQETGYFDDEVSMIAIYNPEHYPVGGDTSTAFRPLNVVVLIMESFSTEYIGSLNGIDDGISYTPCLDSIIQQGLAFRAYANGKQSMEALPAIVAGLPSMIRKPYITSAYGGNRINSLASLLGEMGYSTAFYHGGRNGTMGFESFIGMAGFDKYIGKDEYGNEEEFDGYWGIYDEAFFEFFSSMLDDTQQPFLASFFSLSSHHPYMVPDKYHGKFSQGTLDIHESIMYADYALGKFFEKVSSSDWFDNTLFVITADHTSLSYNKQYRTRAGIYAIPLVFYMPGNIRPEISREIAQQSDIMPSILGYLNYKKPYVAFGNNLFDTTSYRFSVSYLNGTYQLIKDGYSLQFDGSKATTMFFLGGDGPSAMNLLLDEPLKAMELETFLKSIIQQYNHRLISNNLIIRVANE